MRVPSTCHTQSLPSRLAASDYCPQLPGYPELSMEPRASILFPIWGCTLDPRGGGQTDDGAPQDVLGWNTGSWSKVRRLRIPGCGEDADGRARGPKRDLGAPGISPGTAREPNSLLCQLVKWTSWYQGEALCRVTHLGSLPSSPHCSPDPRCHSQPLLLPCLYPS